MSDSGERMLSGTGMEQQVTRTVGPMRSSRRRTAVARASALSLCLLVLVVGCGTQRAGSAAIAGDERLTQAAVTDQVDELSALYEDNPDAQALTEDQLTQAAISWWLNDQVLSEFASTNDIEVTDAQVDQILGPDDQRDQISLSAGVAPSQLEGAARAVVAYQSAAQALTTDGVSQQQAIAELNDQLAQTADDLGVTVNPRFGGGWVPGLEQQLEPRNPDRLSSPVQTQETPLPEPTLGQ